MGAKAEEVATRGLVNATRFFVPLVSVALVVGAGGSAGAQGSTSIAGVVVVTAAPVETTTTKPPTTTPTTRRLVTCENARNHGEYVSSRPKGERATAAKRDCGKRHRPTTTIVGAPTVTTKPAGTIVVTVTSSLQRRLDEDAQGDDENDNSDDSEGRGNDHRIREKAKGKGKN